MKKWLWMGVAVAGLGTLGGVLLPGARAEKKEEKKAEKPNDDAEEKAVTEAAAKAKGVEAITLANQLIEFGRDNDNPEALILAARLLKQNKTEPIKEEPEGGTKSDVTETTADDLLKEAGKLAKELTEKEPNRAKALAVLIDETKNTDFRDISLPGAGKFGPRALAAGKSESVFRNHPAKSVAMVSVSLAPDAKLVSLQYAAAAASKKAALDQTHAKKASDAATAAFKLWGDDLTKAAMAKTPAAREAAENVAEKAEAAYKKLEAARKVASAAAARAAAAATAAQKALSAYHSSGAISPRTLANLKALEAEVAKAEAAVKKADAASDAPENNLAKLADKYKATGKVDDLLALGEAAKRWAALHDAAEAAASKAHLLEARLAKEEKAAHILHVQLLDGTKVVASGEGTTVPLKYTVGAKATALTIKVTNQSGVTLSYTGTTN